MDASTGSSTIEDMAYLTRSEHRVLALVALAVRPRSRSELSEETGVSSSTIRRTLSAFEERGWIRKEGYQYETTQLGGYIATAMAELLERFRTEGQVRDVWEWLPGEEHGFTIEMCAGAVVTKADADDPYRPVNRFMSLLRETDQFRFARFDVALLEPCKEELCQLIVDGLKAEIIDPPRVAKYVRSSCPELFAETLESGNLTLRLHDDLPGFGVGIFDDRVAVCGYDPDSVTVRVLVDSDAPAVREWADSTYAAFRRTTPTIPLESMD